LHGKKEKLLWRSAGLTLKKWLSGLVKIMDLSIIVNHYKTPEILKLCLGYLIKNVNDQELKSEIIVADSKTDQEVQQTIEELYPTVTFIPAKENIGFGRSVNIALKKAKGNYILIINADILVDKKENLIKMIEHLERHPEIGLMGPQLLNINGSHQNSCFRFYTPLIILLRRSFLGRFSFGKKRLDQFILKEKILENKENPIPVDWLMGSALLTKREALNKIGLLDERFFMYFEDVDWCRRFWKAGYRVIYFPKAKMYHYHIQASKKGRGIFDVFVSKYTRIHLTSAIKYFLKHGLKTPKYGI